MTNALQRFIELFAHRVRKADPLFGPRSYSRISGSLQTVGANPFPVGEKRELDDDFISFGRAPVQGGLYV